MEEGKIRVDLPSLEIKMSMKWELVVGCASHSKRCKTAK